MTLPAQPHSPSTARTLHAASLSVHPTQRSCGQHPDCYRRPSKVNAKPAKPQTLPQEQIEVESFYVNSGYISPEAAVFYWFGMFSTAATWPGFKWQDASFGTPTAANYTNWGVLVVPQPGGAALAFPEPNRYESQLELCAGCNATELRRGAWGWADARCDLNFTAMCRAVKRGPCL